ncbi:MAG: hypothetical protein ACLRM8_00295 [Alistipes sp.]
MARFLPWHDVFIVAGLVGLVIAVAWALIYKNPPQEVLAVTMAPTGRSRAEQRRTAAGLHVGRAVDDALALGVLLIRLISDPSGISAASGCRDTCAAWAKRRGSRSRLRST